MQDFVKRLVIEKDELYDKWGKLQDFFATDKFDNLDDENKMLLATQFNIMGAYLCILQRRIDKNYKE